MDDSASPLSGTPNSILLFRTIFPTRSAVLDNASVSFVFASADGSASISPTVLAEDLGTKWMSTPTGATDRLPAYLGPSIDRSTNLGVIEVYDITAHLDGTPHGSPVGSATFTVPTKNVASGNVPEGVAAAISFRSDYGTDVEFAPGTPPGSGPGGRPRSTHRNRIYFGPLDVSALGSEASTSRCILGSQFQTDALAFMTSIVQLTTGPPAWNLQQWSKSKARILRPTLAWLDDRPDYQRRRSDPSSLRQTVVLPTP